VPSGTYDAVVAIITREAAPASSPEGRGGRLVSLMLLGLVVLAGVGYLALAWFTSGRIAHGTSVDGVGIGGLTAAEAEQRLRHDLAGHQDGPLLLAWHGRTFPVDPRAAGMAVDYHATLRAAGAGFSLDPGRIWQFFVGGQDIPAVVTVTGSGLQAQLDRIAAVVGRRPVDGAITFAHGRVHVAPPRPGLELDRAAARELLVHELLHGGRGQVPVGPAQPAIGAAAVEQALHDFAEPAMAAPVVLVVGGQAIIAPPQEYAAALSMVPRGHRLEPVVDGRRLLAAIRPSMTTVGHRPRDARIRLVDGRPVVQPATIAATFDVADLARRFPVYAARPPGQRRMPVKAVVRQPSFTTADAVRLGVDHVVARTGSTFGDGPGADETIGGLARSLDGRLLRPRQELTVTAPANGGSVTATSQLASTVYSAAFAAGLDVVERTALPNYDSDFALGVDARVDGSHALRLRNDTPYGVLVDVRVNAAAPGSPGSVTVRLWSTRYWDVTTSTGPEQAVVPSPVTYDGSAGCRPTTGTAGFTVTVTRLLRHGAQRQRDSFTSSYRPTPTVRCTATAPPSGGGTGGSPGHGHGHGHGHGPVRH
jgi:hypothetical protein